jgi:uncharacterized membrane protein
MDDTTIARTVHVVAVVLWIGGVGFVTTVLLPAVRRMKSPAERVAFFDNIERRFAWQARVTTLLAGLSGLYMLIRLDAWDRFLSARMWWMHAMVMVWLFFTLMLFVAEPFFSFCIADCVSEPEPGRRLRSVPSSGSIGSFSP